MYANLEFLNYIYQNAEMGIVALEDLIKECEDGQFKKLLETQKAYYKDVYEEASFLIGEVHEIPKDIPKMQEISSSMMIKAKTMKDKSPSHMAEMLVQGSTMGIIQLHRNLNKYTENEVDKRTIDLATKLLTNEEKHIETLKKYL
ncbi:MAG: hypothetical protein ACRDDX_12170 [Cellulosilyticaceae bacterium]